MFDRSLKCSSDNFHSPLPVNPGMEAPSNCRRTSGLCRSEVFGRASVPMEHHGNQFVTSGLEMFEGTAADIFLTGLTIQTLSAIHGHGNPRIERDRYCQL